ncbi:tubulin epsilon chain isoform X2 [Pseudorasbora parva]|uniref:tubulin epsilon chain isoform X2 n=1 Tax=Pseudorasbora parva TaxID=51549 RepID=UPI00351ED2C1
MTQSIVVQVGQCGNQVGCRFWDLALREHAHINQTGVYDEALSSFFRNVDQRRGGGADTTGGRITSLKARAVLVDMEEGVLGEILQGPLRSLFNSTQLISDVSGSGNNWAVGHHTYGSTYREQIVDQVRKAAEHCDCLQCFFLIHSMGGGTGSGLGTFVLKLLEEEFPEVCRIVTSVYPTAEDDVITSPYNSILAMKELTEHADCVLPVDNQSLVDIVGKIQHMSNTGKPGCTIKKDCTIISGQGGVVKVEKPFDAMNNIVANLLLNITSSARFEGSLNMDLNEIAMNLVPFPRLHYLVPSLTPLYTLADVNVPPRRLKPTLPFVPWNQEGWKTSLCSVPPVCHTHSLLALANNTCVKSTFSELRERFVKLYRRKAHLHHYLAVDGMELAGFNEALSSISDLIEDYTHLESPLMPNAPRLTIAT